MARYGTRPEGSNLTVWLALALVVVVVLVVVLAVFVRKPPPDNWLPKATREYMKAAYAGEFYRCIGYEDVEGKATYADYERAMRKHYLEGQKRALERVDAQLVHLDEREARVDWRLQVRLVERDLVSRLQGTFIWRKTQKGWRRMPEKWLVEALDLEDEYEDLLENKE